MKRLIFGVSGLSLTQIEKHFFQSSNPFGFILFTRNIQSAPQIRALVQELHACVGWKAPVLIDQEGGRVQRLRAPLWREFPTPLSHVGHPQSERIFWLRGRLIAHELNDLGINVNCTPTVDVARDETHPFLRDRCYGFDSQTVLRHARALVNGQAEGGVDAIVKHIPGHGRGTQDSHLDLPIVMASRKELETDFAPFTGLNDLSMAMTAHLIYKDIDPDFSATQSKKMIDIIRKDIGFDGLLMTDDISMQALSGSITERSRLALQAGCDVTLHCNGQMDEMVALADETPCFDGENLMRAQRAIRHLPIGKDADIPELWAEFEALTSHVSE